MVTGWLQVATLADLENLAAELRLRGEDRKWAELSALLRHTPTVSWLGALPRPAAGDAGGASRGDARYRR